MARSPARPSSAAVGDGHPDSPSFFSSSRCSAASSRRVSAAAASLLGGFTTLSRLALLAPTSVDGHAYLMAPVSRNFWYTPIFQTPSFSDAEYCPHCYQSRGPAAVRQRGEENTPEDVLANYNNGGWPHYASYNRGELTSNGNYLESEEIAVRHGICGDPAQTAGEGSNKFGQENSVYPVLETFEEGSVMEIKVVFSTYHWGHLEFFLCNSEDLDGDGEGSAVTQGCFNMNPLTRAEDDGDASPIDPDHPGRYYVDPVCRAEEGETDQTIPDGALTGSVITARYQLPEGLTCARCIVQMVYYTGNACHHPGYADFNPSSWPSACAPNKEDWITLNPGMCGEDDAYPEEFWNCADIEITASGDITLPSATPAPSAMAQTTPVPDQIDAPQPTSQESPTASPEAAGTYAPVVEYTRQPLSSTPSPVTNDGDGDCEDPAGPYDQCGGDDWMGSTCCEAGFECKEMAPCFSECRPVEDACSVEWEQCGGINWTGSNCCSTGTVCVESNEHYSQCLVDN